MKINRYSKLLLSFAIVSGIVLIILYFFVMNSYYNITVTSSSKSEEGALMYITNEGKQVEAKSIFGLYMIPRSSDYIVAKNENEETYKYINSKVPLGINKLKVDLQPQRHVSKIGTNSLGCDGKLNNTTYFTYSCTGATYDILNYADRKNNQHDNLLIDALPSNDRLVTELYKDGLISIISTDSTKLQYETTSGKPVVIRDLDAESDDQLDIHTSSTNDSFVVANNTRFSLSYYSSIEAKPIEINISNDKLYTACDIDSKTIVCAVTNEKTSKEDEEDSHNANNQELADNTEIIKYDIDSKKQMSHNNKAFIKSICLIDNNIYALDNKEWLHYTSSNDKRSVVADNIKSLTCGEEGVVYTDGESLYRFDKGSVRLVFESDRLALSNIQSSNGSLIFTAFIDSSSRAIPQTYTLTDEKVEYPRLESTLPYTELDEIPVLENDYDDINIYIKPELSITSNALTGITDIDKEALIETKKKINDRLRKDGILDRLNVVYYLR